MRLVDLKPRWMIDEGRVVGVRFDCPGSCCSDKRSPLDIFEMGADVKDLAACPFKIALDGKPYREDGWERVGDTFETLTLKPSVWISPPDHWHGLITDGEVVNV